MSIGGHNKYQANLTVNESPSRFWGSVNKNVTLTHKKNHYARNRNVWRRRAQRD